MSNFIFLKTEWADLHEAAVKAEALAYSDARSACFYARRTLELAVNWVCKHDAPPFTDIAPQGPEGLFSTVEIDALVSTIREFYQTAVA